MRVTSGTPAVGELAGVVAALRDWQRERAPVQLHPGDLGWNWRFGAVATAAALRTWSRDGRLVALGFLDSPALIRMALAPDVGDDEELAHRVLADVTPAAPTPGGYGVEARFGAALREVSTALGWGPGEAWTPLRLDLAAPVPAAALRVRAVGAQDAALRVAVHRAAFDRSSFTLEAWREVAAGIPYADARCLLGFDERGVAVAAATVWSAGPGRPGLLEPLGVHRDHRGHGHGRSITLAAAAALRELGASSATVCTPSANSGGVGAYLSAGFVADPEVCDLHLAP